MTTTAGVDGVELGNDVEAPVVSERVPAPGANLVPSTTPMSMLVSDDKSDVDEDSVILHIDNGQDNQVVCDGGVWMSGYSGTLVTETIDGRKAVRISNLLPPTAGGWEPGVKVIVGLVTSDVVGNTLSTSWTFDVYGKNTATTSWSFTTGDFVTTPPIVNANVVLNGIKISWNIVPKSIMIWDHVELFRSESGFPAVPGEGQLIYSGSNKDVVDDDSIFLPGHTYYYSLFVSIDGSNYYQHDPVSSDLARYRATITAARGDDEYIPLSGDFGASPTMFVSGAYRSKIWGRLQDGARVYEDEIEVEVDDAVLFAPFVGTLSIDDAGHVSVVNKIGISAIFTGCRKSTVTNSKIVRPGDQIAKISGRRIGFRLIKISGKSERLIKPSYFYGLV